MASRGGSLSLATENDGMASYLESWIEQLLEADFFSRNSKLVFKVEIARVAQRRPALFAYSDSGPER